ncbi:MAG: ribbon-helix-helix domain-containing protein [Acidobacteria bacterium]|nr:ribbon-helix-helix domain-containing protein [Acidobacteriota bacterium]MCG3194876.1 hypothetical protein [Thermoanaerobaculia bacterium]
MASVARKNFHLPLSAETYERLREIAEQVNVPATQLAREAIEAWLKERRRQAVAEAIAAYAAQMAGTESDLDASLEASSIASWLETENGR